MKTRTIIALFMLLCGIFSATAHAQQTTPATHMWIKTGLNSLIFVPVNSVEQCQMLTMQAAYINSSEAVCFNANALVRRVFCQKSTKKDGAPSCS